ncbi:MAG: sigma-54 dependent transcriptional regulator, partial [Nitrospinaceae bacterium]
MDPNKILIVEDEEGMRFFISEALDKEGYKHRAVVSGEEAVRVSEKENFDLVILDYNLPKMNGLEVFRKLKGIDPEVSVIMMTGFGDKNLAYDAMRDGVFDFFNKPLDVAEMRVVIRRALERTRLQREICALRSKLQEQYGLARILGESRGIRDVIERIKKVADSDVAVLILGESGTGKEIVAQAIHANSQRRNGPFVKVNCAAVPQDLLEAEFFGFEKGAFTGAVKSKRGKFEQAHGGTLLLDEIGDMPMATQTKILRVIQESELERVGGESPIKINIRLIASTNKNLDQAVADGEFREDLFYRLNVISLPVPPLRERSEDIKTLANHFLKVYSEKFKTNLKSISAEGMEVLKR